MIKEKINIYLIIVLSIFLFNTKSNAAIKNIKYVFKSKTDFYYKIIHFPEIKGQQIYTNLL